MATVYNTEGERTRLGVKYLKNRFIQQKDYYEIMFIVSLIVSLSICFLIELIAPDFFLQNGMIQDVYNAAMNSKGTGDYKTIHSVLSNKEVLSSKTIEILVPKIINGIIFLLYFLFGLFSICFLLFNKYLGDFFKDITKDLHQDKILAGSEILRNTQYLKKIRELGQEKPLRSIRLTGIYEREIIRVLEKEDTTSQKGGNK